MKITKLIYSLVCITTLIFTYSCQNTNNDKPEVIVIENTDPLPSFNNGSAKKNILNFVNEVTTEGGSKFVKPEDRIVCFDNDGTLWAEQPLPNQLFFAIDRVKSIAKDHPEWKTLMPYKAIVTNDLDAMKKFSKGDILKIAGAADSITNVDNFDQIVNEWMNTAQHPVLHKSYLKVVYQPMLELISFLKSKNFKIYIVSGGSIEFMRAWAPKSYGVPTENIIGSTFTRQANQVGDSIYISQTTKFEFNDDHIGKVENINKFIGKKPIMIVGNSDGDLEMMEYATTSNPLPTFCVYVNHTDSVREFYYTAKTPMGRLEKGKTEAIKRGWTIIDMQKDWNTIFPK